MPIIARHNVDNAEIALSMWVCACGEVHAIKDEHQKEIALTELIAEVAANKLTPQNKV